MLLLALTLIASTTAALCVPGRYSSDGTDTTTCSIPCFDCPPSMFSASEGSTSCTYCAFGKFYTGTAGRACDDCPRGFYNDYEGVPSCKACSAGRYGEETPATMTTECISCPRGKYSFAAGASSRTRASTASPASTSATKARSCAIYARPGVTPAEVCQAAICALPVDIVVSTKLEIIPRVFIVR